VASSSIVFVALFTRIEPNRGQRVSECDKRPGIITDEKILANVAKLGYSSALARAELCWAAVT
jgi:hypothetical protein